MDDDGRPIRICFRTVDLVAMEQVWRFPKHRAVTRTTVQRTIRDYLGWDGGQFHEILVADLGGLFDKYEEKWEKQEEEEDDGCYDALGIDLDDACFVLK